VAPPSAQPTASASASPDPIARTYPIAASGSIAHAHLTVSGVTVTP